MAYSFKGSISFGLVFIPIQLHLCVRKNEINFNQLEKESLSRIKYLKTNSEGDIVSKDDIIKGYEYEKDKYVIFDDEDFEKIKSKKDKNIIIEEFIKLDEIDPIYFEKSYYVVPTNASRPFALLLKAMSEENKAGIARTVLGSKSSLIVIRAKDNHMILSTMFFDEEIQVNPLKKEEIEITSQEVELAKSLINSMSSKFEPSKYKDEYTKKVIKAIESKIHGDEIKVTVEDNSPNISNLMDALKESLAQINNA